MRFRHLFWILLALFTIVARADDEPADYRGLLTSHNALRAQVGTAPLSWSNAAAAQAQAWAEQLATEGCEMRYNPDPVRREKLGENILKAFSPQPYEGYKRTAATVVERWSSEGLYYDHTSHTCKAPLGRQCGQYLQMIWSTTEVVGCGRARCPNAEIWVCEYTPRGNQEGVKPYGNPPAAPVLPPVVQGCSVDDAMPAAPVYTPPPFILPPAPTTPH